MNKYLLIGVVVILLIAGGWWYLQNSDTAFAVVIDTPRSNDVLKPGDKSHVTWRTYNFDKINPDWVNNVTLRISIVDANQTPDQARNSGDTVVVDDLPFTEQGSVPFTVPTNLPSGQYQLKMNLFGSGNNTPNQLWGLEYRTSGSFTVQGNSKTFKATSGTTFTLAMGQTATDGGITVKLKSVTGGAYPSTVVHVVSASSTVEAGFAETAKTWGLTQDEYVPGAGVGSYLVWSAKWGDMQWHDPNSPSGTVKIKVTAIDPATQTVTFMISTTPNPADNG